ncbi:hypothetical protein FNF31_01609 [Cafeteria roenbergensis]|uniref:PNPLA domain-containing protein n=1 Tax=Cafeteria roenbergensis TaxID=33653 RepID=A0A5A8DKL5_CAFRO|nr:hypothetical protein FNF31_01609 [Cafeteria roenbergensis]
MSGKPGQAKGDAEDQSRSWSWFAFSGAAPASTGGAGAEPRKTIGELPQGRKEAARSVPAKGGAADASSSPAVGFRSSSAALPGGRDSDSGWHRAVDSSPEADTDEAERPRSSSVSGAGEAMELGEVVVHDEAEGADGRLRLVVESSRAAASASPQEGSRDGIGAGAPAQSAAGSADATSAAASGAGGSAAGAAAAAPASGEPAASTSSSYLSGSMLAVLRNVGLASAPPAPSKQPAATSGAKAAKDAPSAAGTRHQAAPPAERPAQPSAPPAGTGDSIAEYGALMDLHRAELKRDGFTLSFRKQSRPRLVPALRVPGAKPSKPAGTVAISDPDSQAAPKAPKTQRTLLQSVFWAGPPTSDVSTSSPPPSPASGASSGEEEADGSEAEPAAPLARNATASGPSLAEVRERLEGLLEAVTDAQEREALHSGARTLCGVGAPGRTRGGRAGDWPPIDSRSAARGASRGDGSPDQSDEAGSEAVPGRARPGRHARSRSDGHSLAAAAEEAGAAAEAAMSAGHDSPPVASGIKSPTSASVAASVAAASAAGRRSATPEALARSEASARTAPLPQSPGPAGGMHAAGLHNRLRHSARPMADMLAGGDGRHGRGLSILAMDGGGIKGLVTLESLRQIERHTGRRIHELFDLIGGTSTGGLLAMLVGVKRMPLDDIPAIYETIRDKLASATGVFSELHRFASGVIYDDKMTADLLSGILGEGRLDEVPAWPKAFVVASACNSTPAQPYLFRTYELTRAASASSEFLGTSNCLMWEAVRATSSAPTFYNPAVVGGQRFVDGGILANNPAVIALAEAAVIWPHASVSCVVSLGTGMPSSRVHTARSALEWISYIVTDLCLSSHITHAVASSLLGDGQYFRVDPPMVDVSLSEVNKDVLAKMIDSVRAFLEQEPQQRLFRRVARILTARKPRMAAAPGVTQHCAASAAGARDSAAARSAPAGGNAAAAAAAASPPMSPLMAVASVGETPTPLDDDAASAAGLEADGVKPVFPEPAGAAAEAATTAPAERPPAAAPGTESAGKPAARSAQGGEATAQPSSPDSLAKSPRSPASATRQQAASSSAAEDASQPAPPAKGTGSPGAV